MFFCDTDGVEKAGSAPSRWSLEVTSRSKKPSEYTVRESGEFESYLGVCGVVTSRLWLARIGEEGSSTGALGACSS